MKISFHAKLVLAPKDHSNDAIIYLVDEGQEDLLEFDPSFTGKAGQLHSLPHKIVFPDTSYKHVFYLGVGSTKGFGALAAEALGSKISKLLSGEGFSSVYVETSFLANKIAPERLASIANAALLKSYQFTKYKTSGVQSETELVFDAAVEPHFAAHKAVADAVYFARDLANEPPNVINPETMTERTLAALAPLGVKVRVIDVEEMKKLGMGAALAVGQGSATPPRIVVMEYDGTSGQSKDWPLALVGKGLTFDTGGVSLKSDGGVGMKFDMCGAATVIGTMQALAARKANAKVVGVVGLVENAIGSNAYRNDDILTTMNGKTVEVTNTDAEGRLVLCDCLTLVQKEYKPKAIVDLATLTGACLGALGHTMAGVMSNDDALWNKIDKAGKSVNELAWRLPLHVDFSNAMKGTYADLKNTGGRYAGASTAAAFLQEFIEPRVKWAHIDIAGMANGVTGHPTMPDNIGTGFGVRLLDRLVAKHYENKPVVSAAPNLLP